jgi:site-specific recombinase XerD
MAGVDIMTVKDLLGHKSLNMTLRYAHLAPAYKVKALKMLDLQLNNKVYFTLHNRGLSHEKKHLTMKLSA